MLNFKKLNLQLFAGEGASSSGGEGGGEGATTGDNAADAGQQRLMELGVPEHLAKKHSAKAGKRAAVTQVKAPEKATEQVATAEENPTEENQPETKPKFNWEEVKADPDINREIQAIVQQRLRTVKASQEALDKLAPALEVLARKHGQDPANIDYEALAKSINDEDGFYEDKALELGVPVETAKKMDQDEREAARQQRQEQMNLEQQKIQQHIQKLEQQGAAMKTVFPSFDLRKEMQNPVFARMTAPNVGLSVEDAYYAVHRKEIQTAAMQMTAQKTAEKLSNSIQAGQRRPTENGISAQAPSVSTFDYRAASKEQREAFKREILAKAARGEKVYPGR